MSTKSRPHLSARYLALGLFFAVVCLGFLVALAAAQLRGPQYTDEEEGVIRTYTVPGVRGEIYDRSGTLIVGNATSYDLVYEYGAMPDTRREVNLALLAVLRALDETGNGDKLSEDRFPLQGTYPDMKFSAELKDKTSPHTSAYRSFLSDHEMKESETDAADVAEYFVDRYGLIDSLYTEEEITGLIRLYYEMERVDFGLYASYTIAENVNMNLITSIEESNIEGVNFRLNTERVYHYPGIASHILGQMGKITAENAEKYIAKGYPLDAKIGVSGCEAAFEDWLHGQDGKMVIRYDDNGNQIEKYYETEPVSGNDIYLTIDIDLQIAAEEGLAENVEAVDTADAGAITVLDPDTGEVLAIASYPTYDLTRIREVEYYQSLLTNGNLPLYNRALQGVYAPGSTYKVGAAVAALELGEINANDTKQCTGTYPHLHHPTCLGIHQTTNVVDAIRQSCNVFFYYLGDSMGIDALTDYTKKMGLGVETGIELYEKTGIVAGPTYRRQNGLTAWVEGDDLSAAIGQSDHGYTPLQLSNYISTVVNGGTRYNVHLLESIRAFYSGEVLEKTEITVADQVEISDKTYDLLIESMRQVVADNDTLRRYFAGVPVTVGGKTGTAEVSGKRDYAVFCGFAPLERPELVISCIIEEGVYGQRAALAVSRVMEVYFAKQAAEIDKNT